MGFIKLKELEHKGLPFRTITSKQRDHAVSSLVKMVTTQTKLWQGEYDEDGYNSCSLNLSKVKPIFLMNHMITNGNGRANLQSSSFLKSCFFCNQTLRLDKQIYMYRGELGFCSVDCRNRQIYLDDMKNIETYTKKMLASIRRRREGGRCSETTVLSEGYGQCGNPLTSCSGNRVTFTIS